MFNLAEYKEPSRLCHRLPWAIFIEKGIILNKVGSFQTTSGFRGPDLYSSTEEELDAISAQINNAFKRLGSGWSYFIESQRREISEYSDSNLPDLASRLIDQERKEIFLGHKNYSSNFFLTFIYLPQTENINRLGKHFFSTDKQSNIDYSKDLEYFLSETNKIQDILKNLFPFTRNLNDSETLSYLHSCVSTKKHRIIAPDFPIFLDSIITDQALEGGINPKLGDHYLKIISINGFPANSYPQIISDLDKVSCEYRWMTRFICLDKSESIKEIRKYSKKWFAKRKSIISLVKEAFTNEQSDIGDDSDATRKAMECDEAADAIASGAVSSGYYTSTIVLWDKDQDRLQEKVRLIEAVINTAGFSTINETFNAVQAWFGTIPGHVWSNVRRPLMTSLNLAHLIPLSTDWLGKEQNEHLKGPPLFYANTDEDVPFRFSNHVGDVGHTMIAGPTGSGKSVLLNFMAAQFLRYPDANVYFFDKEYSAYCLTMATGGKHYDLGTDQQTSFQPLKSIDNLMERAWALEWIQGLLSQEKIEIGPGVKKELWDSLSNLAASPEKQRTITGLTTLIQSDELRQALEIYTISGAYGYLLDSDTDDMQTAKWQCFEMDFIIKYFQNAVAPVLTYLFHQLDLRFTGKPTMLILDEA